MAIDAKQHFLRMIEKQCEDQLTAKDLAGVMKIVGDVMEGFRIEELNTGAYDMADDDLVRAFIESLTVQGRSAKTIERYELIIGLFMKYVKISARAVTVYHIRDWLADGKNRGLQDSTLKGNRAVLSSYFNWLYREGLIERNPINNVGVIKVAKKVKKTYSDTDLERMNMNAWTLRNRAILHFLRSTGCRISEMISLDRSAVHLETLECVVHGKGNKDRTVYMDAVAGMVLEEYLNSRKDDDPALFIGKQGRLQAGGVRGMLKKLGRISCVDHVHPHKFRRTLATDLSSHGMPIQEIAVLLGHEQLDTTMKYVMVDQENTRHDYRRFA